MSTSCSTARRPRRPPDGDLENCEVRDDGGFSRSFTVDPFRRHCLLEGLDNIGLSLKHVDEIAAWEAAHGLAPLSGGAT